MPILRNELNCFTACHEPKSPAFVFHPVKKCFAKMQFASRIERSIFIVGQNRLGWGHFKGFECGIGCIKFQEHADGDGQYKDS